MTGSERISLRSRGCLSAGLQGVLAAGAAVVILGLLAVTGSAGAAPRLCDDGTRPPCHKDVGEGEGNRLSYPVILPENEAPGGFPAPLAWTFATITDPASECFVGNTGGLPVDPSYDCYFDGSQVWWLSQRAANFWKAFSVAPDSGTGAVLVTAVDAGDLLESSPNLNFRRIRTEFTLYQDALRDDRFSASVPTFDVNGELAFPFPAPCNTPEAGIELGCFAAFSMSDAVPGTEQSINEIQGTDFGTNTADDTVGEASASGRLLDPALVKTANADIGALSVHATVYSNCARLVIQQLGTMAPVWNPVDGLWDNAEAPVVNVATYTDLGNGGMYSAEINASGTLIYGYNWNATRDSNGPGDYRLTFVLDGPPRCGNLNAEFGDSLDGTYVVNRGEVATTHVIPKGDARLNGGTEGGLAYIDVNLVKKGNKGGGGPGGGSGGGGSGGGGGPGGPRH